MKVDSKHYAQIGQQAAERAAKKVIEQAQKENKPMPVWEAGKTEYKIPAQPKSR